MATYSSHCGFIIVPSKLWAVLYSSCSPVCAAFSVLANSAATCSWLSGRNVRAVCNACCRMGSESQPVITTLVGKFSAYCRHSTAPAVLLFRIRPSPMGFMPSTPMLCATSTGSTSFSKLVLLVRVAHNIGVLGMKPMGDGLILKSKTAGAVECLQYALNLPTSVVITGCDTLPILQQALQTARTFRPLSKEQVAALLAKTDKVAQTGEHELYKTAHNFDGTIMNPQ